SGAPPRRPLARRSRRDPGAPPRAQSRPRPRRRRSPSPAWSVLDNLDPVARRDRAAGDDLGIDAAIAMAASPEQAVRDRQVADAGAGLHIGGGAPLDALDDPRAGVRAERQRLADQ